ncbi:acyltransferase [Echinicola pacifica]|uniref:Acyltransferase n=1 Tax=Echinicola pacifica TaxID=346377 RepID=A0A918UVE4_9BACT|nr:hypothetical protein [Echinicola pacifica]GGZ36932.1 acyltransferase [Echinicola pacifica]
MNYFKSFSERVLNLQGNEFDALALELFRFQAQHNLIYSAYLKARGLEVEAVSTVEQIPFLPIQFFKSHAVISGPSSDYADFYSSSGTTGQITSRHWIWEESFYLQHAQRIFEQHYGDLTDFHVLAMLPAYLERKGSSLVSMADHFIKKTGSDYSGFYLYNYDMLIDQLLKIRHLQDGKKVLLLGVTFALLDLAEQFGEDFPPLDQLIIMETGGMKGRRKEMIREEVHEVLKRGLKVSSIHSEYGMTELFSQAYSDGEGLYKLPASMKVFLRDVNDPLSWSDKGQGGVNIIDLANFHSCAFIETQDLGKYDEKGMLKILGRFDNSEVRGCNLMVN